MADIQLQCLGCDHVFLVPDDQAGLLVSCPQCNRKIAVPVPAEHRAGAPKLAVRRETTAGGGMTCPSCGAIMPPGAVLCVECGYDMRKGVRIGESVGWPPYVRWLLAGAGVLIAVMLVRVFLRPRPIAEIAAPPPAISVPVPPPAPPPPTSTPVQVAEPAPPPEPAIEQTPEAPPAEQKVSEEELARLEAEYRTSLKGRLDQQQPLYRPGDTVELRKLNGLVIRGKVKARGPDGMVVVREEGEITVPLAELDHASRLRSDQVFRDKIVELKAKKDVRSIQPPTAP